MALPFFSRTQTPSEQTAGPPAPELSTEPPSAANPDLYAILGVAAHASQEEIRGAYRRQASSLVDRWWLPGLAERKLALLNSAYEILGHTSRRAEYDAQRNLGYRMVGRVDDPGEIVNAHSTSVGANGFARQNRRPRSRGTGLPDAIVIVLVVALALGTASVIISVFSPSLTGILDLTESWGVTPKRRAAAAVDSRPKPLASPEVALVGQATAQPSPTTAPPTGLERYAGTQVDVSDPNPPRRSQITVTLRLVRDGQPVEGALVYLIARFRTTEERWPQGTATVRTDAQGQAQVSFNIGDATAGFLVPIEMVTLVEGQQFSWRSQFTPR